MNMVLETIPSCRIAYIRQVGPYGADNGQMMATLKSWAAKNNLLDDRSVILGIAHDDPAATAPESCRYDVCLVVSDDYRIEGSSVRDGRIAGGKYAVFMIEHTAEAIQTAWLTLFTELSNHGLSLDGTRPVLERYAAAMVKNHRCEICAPIR